MWRVAAPFTGSGPVTAVGCDVIGKARVPVPMRVPVCAAGSASANTLTSNWPPFIWASGLALLGNNVNATGLVIVPRKLPSHHIEFLSPGDDELANNGWLVWV